MVTCDRIGVLIADDDHEIRSTLEAIISTDPGLHVVARCADGSEVLAGVHEYRPDLILLDIRMPRLDGLKTLRELRQSGQATPVIMLTTFGDSDNVRQAISHGADGFLLKTDDPEQLLAAIHGTTRGETWLSPHVAGYLAADARRYHHTHPRHATEATRALATLTPREREVAELVALGLSNQEISSRLFLSESTIKAYVSTALDRVNRRNRVELALLVWAAPKAT